MATTEYTEESLATEKARALFDEGFTVIPLGSPSEPIPSWFRSRYTSDEEAVEAWPKTPRVKWAEYQRQPPPDAVFEGWCRAWPRANWAVITGRDVTVIDADSAEAVAFMRSGAVTRSPRTVSTSKGAHFYYRANPALRLRNSVNHVTKIDVRADGGYVVAPGSVHSSGVVYTEEILSGWGDAGILDLPMLTPADLEAIARFNGKGIQKSSNVIDFTGPGNLRFDATQLPSTADAGQGVAQGGRNNAAAALAGKLLRQGTDLQTVLRTMQGWNALNGPPLPDAELRKTIASVATTHMRNHPEQPIAVEPGIDLSAAQASVLPELEVVDAVTLEGVTPAPVTWAWHDWLPKGCAAGIFAEGGTGKSLLALQLAICRAAQIPFLDGVVPPAGRTLLLFCEDDLKIITLRLHRLMERYGLTWSQIAGQVLILARVGADNALMTFDNRDVGQLTPFWHQLRSTINRYRPDLLIADTRNDVFVGREVDTSQVRQFINRALTSLAQDFDLAAVFLAHVSVQGKASGSGLSGTNAWRDAARVQIYMQRAEGADAIEVTRLKSNHSASGATFSVHNDAGFLLPSVVDLTTQIDEVAQIDFLALLDVFTAQGNAVSSSNRTQFYAPKQFTRYATANPSKYRTIELPRYEKAMFQLLEQGAIKLETDDRKKTSARIVRATAEIEK